MLFFTFLKFCDFCCCSCPFLSSFFYFLCHSKRNDNGIVACCWYWALEHLESQFVKISSKNRTGCKGKIKVEKVCFSISSKTAVICRKNKNFIFLFVFLFIFFLNFVVPNYNDLFYQLFFKIISKNYELSPSRNTYSCSFTSCCR